MHCLFCLRKREWHKLHIHTIPAYEPCRNLEVGSVNGGSIDWFRLNAVTNGVTRLNKKACSTAGIAVLCPLVKPGSHLMTAKLLNWQLGGDIKLQGNRDGWGDVGPGTVPVSA